MVTNATPQTLWGAWRTIGGRHACRRCLADSWRLRLSRSIASHSGSQSVSKGGRISDFERNRALTSFASQLQPQQPGKEFAILGGGITGLTTAYYLTQFYPTAKITIYESNNRLGGWVDTEKVQVRSKGKDETVVFERGPRTVAAQTNTPKWDDFVLWDLIDSLGLEQDVYCMPKNPGPMMRRYIYHPDHLVDVTAPVTDLNDPMGTLRAWLHAAGNVLTEPLFKGMLPSLANFLRTPAESNSRPLGDYTLRDVSIGEYFASKFGRPDVVNNLLSALIHGVYGGDVWKLSMESGLFRRLLLNDQLDVEPVLKGGMFVELQDIYSAHDIITRNGNVIDVARMSMDWGFIGFFNGFSTLTDAIVDKLRKNPKVTLKTGESVTALRFNEETQNVEVHSGKTEEAKQYGQVISTIFSGTLGKLTGDSLPTLKEQKAVTIQVVNLWYPTPNLNAPHSGFGYLIPGSVPAANNPHCALGVLFDSDRDSASGRPQDPTVLKRGRMDTVEGTKFTVMLGGHHWDWLPPENWPDAKEAAEMAKETVQRQLGIPESAQKGVVASTKICRECIPQQYVGHRQRMHAAHNELLDAFRGKLTVAGGSYTPPGVLPSLRAGRDAALQVAGHGYLDYGTPHTNPLDHVGETGLAWATRACPDLAPYMKNKVPFRYGN